MRITLQFVASVAIVLCINQAVAAEAGTPSSLENFNLGGYSSAGINVHPGGKTDGALNEISLFLSWEDSGRFRFFSELGLERPLSFNEGETAVGKDFYFNLERLYQLARKTSSFRVRM